MNGAIFQPGSTCQKLCKTMKESWQMLWSKVNPMHFFQSPHFGKFLRHLPYLCQAYLKDSCTKEVQKPCKNIV